MNKIALKEYFKLHQERIRVDDATRTLSLILTDDQELAEYILDAEKALREARSRIDFMMSIRERDI